MPKRTPLTPQQRMELVTSHEWIARRLMRRYALKDQFMMSTEDVGQTARLGLIYAAQRFDPSKGNSFATFAWRYALGEVMHSFRKSRMIAQRKSPRRATYYTVLRFDRRTPLPAVEDPELDRAEGRADLLRLLKRLPEGQRRILGLTLYGWSHDGISQRVGVNQTQISRDLRRSMKVLKDLPVRRPKGWEKRYA